MFLTRMTKPRPGLPVGGARVRRIVRFLNMGQLRSSGLIKMPRESRLGKLIFGFSFHLKQGWRLGTRSVQSRNVKEKDQGESVHVRNKVI